MVTYNREQALQIALIGPFSVHTADGTDITPGGKRARAMLAMLALSKNGRRSRAWLQDHLWSNKTQELGRASLRQELTGLRRAFRQLGVEVLGSHGSDIVLDISLIRLNFGDKSTPDYSELLEGVDVDDPEFEYWLSEERAHWYGRISEQSKNNTPSELPDDTRIEAKPPGEMRPSILFTEIEFDTSDQSEQKYSASLEAEIVTAFGSIEETFTLFRVGGNHPAQVNLLLAGRVIQATSTRVSFVLSSVADSRVLWSGRYDTDLVNDFSVHERVAREVVEAVQGTIGEKGRFGQDPPPNVPYRAWEVYQRARSLESLGGRRRLIPSIEALRDAIAHEPNFWAAKVSLGFRIIDGIRNCWLPNEAPYLSELRSFSVEITKNDMKDSWSQALLSFIECANGQFESGRNSIIKLIGIHPNSSELHGQAGAISDYLSLFSEAINYYEYAISLSDYPPAWIHSNLSLSFFMNGDHDAAREKAEFVLRYDSSNVKSQIVTALCLLRDGRVDDAKNISRKIKKIDPLFDAATWRNPRFFSDKVDYDGVFRALRSIGL